jgi:hypothetical protein
MLGSGERNMYNMFSCLLFVRVFGVMFSHKDTVQCLSASSILAEGKKNPIELWLLLSLRTLVQLSLSQIALHCHFSRSNVLLPGPFFSLYFQARCLSKVNASFFCARARGWRLSSMPV